LNALISSANLRVFSEAYRFGRFDGSIFICMALYPKIRRFSGSGFALLVAVLFALPACHRRPKDESIPIRLAPGETVTIERVPAKVGDGFAFRAVAGQTLYLELGENCPTCGPWNGNVTGHMQVFLADGTHPAELPSQPLWGIPGQQWMNVLPMSGVYHIIVTIEPVKRYHLEVTLMDAHDPRLDPGITPDGVSIPEGLLPKGSRLALQEYAPWPGGYGPPDIDGNLPANLSFKSEGTWLSVMRLEGLKKANSYWQEIAAELEQTTLPDAVAAKPTILTFDDTFLMHWGRLERFEGKSWRGWRWIGDYEQEDIELQNPLQYVFAAISNDRQYIIWLWTHIDFVHAPHGIFQLSDKESIIDSKTSAAYQQKVNAALTSASPSSFKPDLAQLDSAVRSLEFRQSW